MDQDWEARIRARAYEIWEREGQQEGSHLAHWEQAENELREEEAGERLQSTPSAEEPEVGGQSPAGGGSTADAPAKQRQNNVKKA